MNTNWECQIFLHQSCSTHTAQVRQLFLKHDQTLKSPHQGDPEGRHKWHRYTEYQYRFITVWIVFTSSRPGLNS